MIPHAPQVGGGGVTFSAAGAPSPPDGRWGAGAVSVHRRTRPPLRRALRARAGRGGVGGALRRARRAPLLLTAPSAARLLQVGPAERIARINRACLELVEGDVACGCYATFASVLSRFCQRAGVAQFEHLGLGPPIGVPCLRYLWDLQVGAGVRPPPAVIARAAHRAGNRRPLHPHLHLDARHRHPRRSGIRARGSPQLLLRPLSPRVPRRRVPARAHTRIPRTLLPRGVFRRRRAAPSAQRPCCTRARRRGQAPSLRAWERRRREEGMEWGPQRYCVVIV